MARFTFLLSVVLLLIGNITTVAHAHEVRPAYLQLTEVVEDQYHILWKQPIVQNRRLPIDPVFPEACELSDLAAPEVTSAALIYRWQTNCDLAKSTIHISGLTVTLTDVMVRLDRLNGDSNNYLLRPEGPTLDLTDAVASTTSYLVIGVEHLVFGIDHVLFVVGLFLFIRSPLMLLKTITAFTVAHSLTLALSVLEVVSLEQGPIEAIIALSILFLARELVQEEADRSAITNASPWIMAFIFGLLHGLGFAGALADIGLPEDSLWVALLLFNVGIELGQIAIIMLLAAVFWVLSKYRENLTRITAWGMGSLAAFWTIDRTLVLL